MAVPCGLRLASSRGRRTSCGLLRLSRWRVGLLPSLRVVSCGKDCTQNEACSLRWVGSRGIVMLVHFAAVEIGVVAVPSILKALGVYSGFSMTLDSPGLVDGVLLCFNGVKSLKASCSPRQLLYTYVRQRTWPPWPRCILHSGRRFMSLLLHPGQPVTCSAIGPAPHNR